MNVLTRNKQVILEHDEKGTTLVELGRRYGVSPTAIGLMYYRFLPLINKPWYDTIAGIDLDDQRGVKLVNALAKYEVTYGVELTPELIADGMDMTNFRCMRGVGDSIEAALKCAQMCIRAKRRHA